MNNFYNPVDFSHIAAVEDRHFWFVERNRLIGWALAKYFPSATSFADIGCGTGVVLRALERTFPQLTLTGIDPFPEALAIAQSRLDRTTLRLGDIINLGGTGEFDVVGSFDVVEHIPDDLAALASLREAVKPGGGLLLAVPQHRFLWSVSDEIGLHQRRYERKELARKVRSAGFRILRLTSFVSFLLPIVWMQRRRAVSKEDALSELRIGSAANFAGGTLMALERLLIRSGLSLPVGSSLLLVAQRM